MAGYLLLVARLTGIGGASLALGLTFRYILLLARPTMVLHMW